MTEDLRSAATRVAQHAYAPHSGYHVGAALRSVSGHTYVGCNVENASFSVGSCAERAAISTAVAAEGHAFRMAAIAVVALNARGEPLPVTPCGACRQALVEFGDDAEVGFNGPGGLWQTVCAGELLPYRFILPDTGPR
ncbi:MAG TPA: cytidine deaminase [Patescibacteria group bacterium]|nr:cytidine deaminase [Patescibacteria group bacterium]